MGRIQLGIFTEGKGPREGSQGRVPGKGLSGRIQLDISSIEREVFSELGISPKEGRVCGEEYSLAVLL